MAGAGLAVKAIGRMLESSRSVVRSAGSLIDDVIGPESRVAAASVARATKAAAGNAEKAERVILKTKGLTGNVTGFMDNTRDMYRTLGRSAPTKMFSSSLSRTTRAGMALGVVAGVGAGVVSSSLDTVRDGAKTFGTSSSFASAYAINQTFQSNGNSGKNRLHASTYDLVQSMSSGKSTTMRAIHRP